MPLAEIDYVDIYDFPSLTEIKKVEHQALAAVAVKFGKTRLIDNRIWERNKVGRPKHEANVFTNKCKTRGGLILPFYRTIRKSLCF